MHCGDGASGFADRRQESLAQRKLQQIADSSPQVRKMEALQRKIHASAGAASSNGTVQLEAYRKARWTNPGQYANSGPYVETIEDNPWMNIQALKAYPHIQEAEMSAARDGQGNAVTMYASNANAWKAYEPAGARWRAAVDPSHTVLSLWGKGAFGLAGVMAAVDTAWGSTNVQEDDIRHMSTHDAVYTIFHRHTVMPPGSTIGAGSFTALATALAKNKQFDDVTFKWATDVAQRGAKVNLWAQNMAANLL
jgi:hypothetical protein